MKDPKKQKQKTYKRRKNSYEKNTAKQYNLLSQIDEANSKINNFKLDILIDKFDLGARVFSDTFVGTCTSLLSLVLMSDEGNNFREVLSMSQDKIEAEPILIAVPILSLVAGATVQDFLYGKLWKNKSYSDILDDFKYNKELKKQKKELTKKYKKKFVDSGIQK